MRPLDALLKGRLALQRNLEPSAVWEHYRSRQGAGSEAAPEVQRRDGVRSLIE